MTPQITNANIIPEAHEGHSIRATVVFAMGFCDDCSEWVHLQISEGGSRPRMEQ